MSISGIYVITDMKNGKQYVGQTDDLPRRRDQHLYFLKNSVHPNKQMQRDFKKHKNFFRWDVLEICPTTDLNRREKYWIEKLQTMAPKGYNKTWVPYKRKTNLRK